MKRKKILLLGSTGMLGHVVYYYLNKLNIYDIENVSFRARLTPNSHILDITHKQQVELLIKKLKPNVIINCIGVLIKGSHQDPGNAIYINSYFPHTLARYSNDIDAKLIHISTDCVFSGKRGNYSENDFRDADDIYGRSKALGEIIDGRNLTLRTSIIGPELKENGEGLFQWFMNQGGEINGYVNAYWGGVTTLELAKAINKGIKNNLTGLLQVSNGIAINKYDLLKLFKTVFVKSDVTILPFENERIDKSLKASELFDFSVPNYDIMINELKEWIKNYSYLYE